MSDKQLLDVCYEMESIFVGQMLKSMRNTIDETDFFGKSMAKDLFNDMLYDEYAKLMAESDAFGLARQIYDQLR
jgi:flagellar protein FlgJ